MTPTATRPRFGWMKAWHPGIVRGDTVQMKRGSGFKPGRYDVLYRRGEEMFVARQGNYAPAAEPRGESR